MVFLREVFKAQSSKLDDYSVRHADDAMRATYLLDHQLSAFSARKRLTQGQLISLVFVFLSVAFLISQELFFSFFTVFFIVFCLATTFLRVLLFALSLKKTITPLSSAQQLIYDDGLPIITILIPLYDEAESLPSLISSLLDLDYPQEKLDIKILLERDDWATMKAAIKLCNAPCFDLVYVPRSGPRTKPKACNIGLWQAKGTYTVIYDAEDRPEPDQLRKAVATFQVLPENIACLQARLNYYNWDQSVITRLFTLEYTLLFNHFLPGLVRLGAPIPLGGTSNFFKTNCLQQVCGWDAFNVTEDADLGLRLEAAGLRSEVLNSTTWEEATASTGPWLRQRSRWIKGFMQTWFVHMRAKPKAYRKTRKSTYITLHFFIGGVIFSSLLNLLYWGLLLGEVIGTFSILPKAMFLPHWVGTALLFANLCQIGLLAAAALNQKWWRLASASLLAPFYWLLQSIAGYKALWQFCTRPFYWEKTMHGRSVEGDVAYIKSGGTKPRRAGMENNNSLEYNPSK